MIEFIPLASSSEGNAYVVKSEGHQPLLIDCGVSFTDLQKLLWSVGVDVTDLAGCLISHGHADHCKAAAKLMAAGVDCYASREAWQSMGLSGHRAKGVGFGVESAMATHIVDKWQFWGFHGVHDEPGILGFLISASRGQLMYLTDSAYCPHRFAGLTHICVEANYSEEKLKENAMTGRVAVEVAKRTLQTHASIERVLDMLKANDLSRCQEIHLLHLSDSNSDAEGFKRQVEGATGIPCFIAPKRRKSDA